MRRQDPEQCDEGVDMQSECETDSLTEDGLESQEGGEKEDESENEGQEAELEDDGEVEREDVTVMMGGEERDSVEQNEERSEEEEESMQGQEQCDRKESQASGRRSHSSSPKGSEPANADQRADISSESDAVPVSEENISTNTGRKKQPWELVDDPFTLVRIEQVIN